MRRLDQSARSGIACVVAVEALKFVRAHVQRESLLFPVLTVIRKTKVLQPLCFSDVLSRYEQALEVVVWTIGGPAD